MVFLKKHIQLFLTLALLAALADGLAEWIEASTSSSLDIFVAVLSLVIYSLAAIFIWIRPNVGKFLASWIFLFNVLIGIPLFIDFFITDGFEAQLLEPLGGVLFSGIFFAIAWRWKPNERNSVG